MGGQGRLITLLITTYSLLNGLCGASPASETSGVSGTEVTSASASTVTPDSDTAFTTAVEIAISVSEELAKLSPTGGSIPLPSNIPQYEELKVLADHWPPFQVTSEPLTEEFIAQLRAAGNASSSLERRQGGPLRVMAVGDSMTHCVDGDYTWRYRISQWFQSQGIAIDMVGPYVGTGGKPPVGPPQPPPLYGSENAPLPMNHEGGYAAAFDSDHFANSGRAAGVVQGLIEDVTATYQPDLMLIMLGFNDIAWFYSDGPGLLGSMNSLINNARRAKPDIKFVVGTVPQRPFIAGRSDLITHTDEYNRLLRANVPDWNTPDSPIVIAPIREEYTCSPTDNCPSAHDGLHPNERGDFEIARAFSRALVHGLSIGNEPLVVPNPIPWVPLPTPGNIQVFSSPQGVTATWDPVPNVYSYDIDYKINGYQIFMFSPGNVPNNRWDSRWAGDGWIYEVRIRSARGDKKGEWSAWYSATARPQTAPVPTDITIRSTATGMALSWTPPTGPYTDSIILYNIFYFDMDQPCAFLGGAAFTGPTAQIDGLVQGHRYLVGMEVWNANGAGFPGLALNIVPGRGVPGVPQNFRITSNDATTAVLQWDKTDGAGNYRLWRRSINSNTDFERFDPLGDTCAAAYFQFPGVWTYEWAVSALNGVDEGPRGAGVIAPEPNGASATCPAAPEWCPAGSPESPPPFDAIDGSDPLPPPDGNGDGDDDDDDDNGGGGGGGGGGGNGDNDGDGEDDNPEDPTCTGSCNVCSGPSCQGCEGPSCSTCRGLGCGAGRFRCLGANCDICKGADCAQCNSDDCETCVGDDCDAGSHTCAGGGCSFCFGPGCSGCKGGNCETCRGAGCSNSDNSCDDADCSTCVGFCNGSNGGCVGLFCSTCSGIGCSGCTVGPCERCFGIDCLGCNTAGCSTCRGLSCGGCSSEDCTSCSGPSCDSGGNCIGSGCPPGSNPPAQTGGGGSENPTSTSSCSSSTTTSNCEVTCTVEPSQTDQPSCSTVTCTSTVGCSVTATTTTETTTVTCPAYTGADYYANDDQDAATIGNGGYGGAIVNMGTWTSPTYSPPPETPVTTSTQAPPTETPTGPPRGSQRFCISSHTQPQSNGITLYSYVGFNPESEGDCGGVFLSDATFEYESICRVPEQGQSIPYYCENTSLVIVDEGEPPFPDSQCGIAMRINDDLYTEYEALDGSDPNNPCSRSCGSASIGGLVLFTGLPDC